MLMAIFSATEAMVAWLSSMGYRVSTRVPKDTPDEIVTVERTGGGVDGMVDHPMMAVQCWAPTEARAEEMANAIRLAALTTAPPAGVHSVRVNSGPYPFFDEDTRSPRYQLVLGLSSQLTTND